MSFKLKWENSLESQFQTIYRANEPFEFDRLPDVYATVDKGVTEFTDTAIEQFAPYHYRVASNRELKGQSEQVVSQLVSAGFMGGPSLNLDFAGQSFSVMQPSGAMSAKPFSEIVTFTRASTGTYFDANGVLQVAALSQPRFDHDPVTGQSLGILIEEQRTNLLLRSSEFDNSAWGNVGVTVAPDTVVAPNGTLTADKLVENTGDSRHDTNQYVTVVAGVYTYSQYVKAGERNWVKLRLGPIGVLTGAWFNLATGVVGAVDTGYTASIVAVGAGWYRCSITTTLPAGGAAPSVFIAPSDGVSVYQGDGTSGIYIWGAQVEAGEFPTSYIPTAASQVTRAADVCSVNTLSPWYNPEQGTLVVEGDITSRTSSRVLADIGAGGAFGTTLYMAHVAGATYAAPPVAPVNTFASVPDTALTFKSALAMRKNGMTVASNGVLGSTDVLCEMPMAPNKLTIGKGGWSGGDSSLNGHIQSLRYYPRRLTDSELQAITS